MARRVLHLPERGRTVADAPAPPTGVAPNDASAPAGVATPSDAPAANAVAAEPAPTARKRARTPRRPRKTSGATVAADAPRAPSDPFTERLRALEREIDDVLAGVSPGSDAGLVNAARSAAEELLAFYADLARALRRGGVGEMFIRLRMIGTAEAVDDFGFDRGFAARAEPLLDFLYRRWWRVELDGVEQVPATGRALLVANHSGGFLPYDGLMLQQGLRARRSGGAEDVRPLVEDFVYRLPWVGPTLTRLGAVRASAENAERLLARERVVAVFPEGAKGVGKYYRDRYRLQRFARGGFVTLALRTGAPLVPVAILGGEEIHPVIAKWQTVARLLDLPYFPVTPTFPWLGVLGLVPLPTKWRIVFGAPLELAAEHGRDAADDDLLVNRLREQVRERIQRMVVDGLRERRSVFT